MPVESSAASDELGTPLIVQGDLTVMLEVATPGSQIARAQLARFAELEKAPEHVHTYRITPLSLWNAAVAGMSAEEVLDTLVGFAKYPVADVVADTVTDLMGRYGRLWLTRDADGLVLASDDELLLDQMIATESVAEFLGNRLDRHRIAVRDADRGTLKQGLLVAAWPVADEAGFEAGTAIDSLLLTAELRDYQRDALDAWWADGSPAGGNGVIALPCGAGKTVVGLAAMVAAGAQALVVCTSVSSIRQWIREALDKTNLTEEQVGEWSGRRKQLRAVTFVTYQALTWSDPRAERDDVFVRHPHLALFGEQDWGLVVYDEVHLLPAPVFRATAEEKLPIVELLVNRHRSLGEQVLVIGQFVDQLRSIAELLDAPLITGQTTQRRRDLLFDEMRAGSLPVLVVSKVANFSIDLPEVSVAIQVSGQFGSRQEEAQRLGRILRPKADGGQAHFYSLVSDDTDEVAFARNRQRFLAEQGYAYAIVDAGRLEG